MEALTGRFNDHHAFLLSKLLARIDTINADIGDLDARIAIGPTRGELSHSPRPSGATGREFVVVGAVR